MPQFARSPAGIVVDASVASNEGTFFCCKCDKPLVYVRSSDRTRAYFRHVEQNDSCSDSKPTEVVNTSASPVVTRAMTAWHAAWQKMGEAVNPRRRESRGIGRDTERPRDLGDRDANSMVEIQHSSMSSDEYDNRNAGLSCATWIFDATLETLFAYSFAENTWFCSDSFHAQYGTDSRRRVLFHCADGNLYETACDDAVHIRINDDERYVRILKPIDAATRAELNTFFGDAWPLQRWDGAPEFTVPQMEFSPLRVLSEAGRREMDRYHRDFMYCPPTAPCTVISAPPGAGKTTAIIEMLRRWQIDALVITFNKATQETMQQRMNKFGIRGARARTMDSLCYEACSKPQLMKWSDWELCNKFWPKSAKTKLGRSGSARRSSNIVDFRFRHPGARASICKQHRRLSGAGNDDWDAGFATYPMHEIAESCKTFAACRYHCDQNRLLCSQLDAYDVILVDEMQDLISAQEQRLIFQTCKPVVLVGDFMQAINNFRDDPPCVECDLAQEDAPKLPCALEWYGTWRLDNFTVRFIEERFGRRMYSYRAGAETSEVYWKDRLVYEDTFVMCRYNRNLVEVAQRYPHVRVVSGESLAQRLIAASKDDSMSSPMASFARELKSGGTLDTVCEMLRGRSIRLADVIDVAAVATVHQAKGFEYEHCAVHNDLLSPTTEDERNISFVAFTRHKKSLVVMASPPPSADESRTHPAVTAL